MSERAAGLARARPRPSARVRRRRSVAALLIAVAVAALVVAAWPRGAARRNVSKATGGAAAAARRSTRIDASLSAALLPQPRSRAVAVADGSGLLVAGGIDSQGNSTASTLQFVAPSSLVEAAPLAVPMHDGAGVELGDHTIIFGGGAGSVGDQVQQSSAGGPFSVIGHLPTPRADFAAVTVGGTAYLVGGYDGSALSRDVLATTDGRTFHTVAQLPHAVRYPAVTTRGSTIYIFGGESGGVSSDAIQAVDTGTGRAEQIGVLPGPRTQAAAFTLGGSIYVAGGLLGSSPSADILRFDPDTGRIATVGSLPNPVADAAVAVAGGAAYLVGGEAHSPVAGIDVLVPTTTSPSSHLALSRERPFAGKLLVADRGNNRLVVLDRASNVLWSYPSPARPAPPGGFYFPDDAFFVDHGRAILSNEEENHTIVRIAYPSGALLWSYGQPQVPGAAPGFLNQPDDAFLLRDGTTTVADAKNCRVLFLSSTRQPLSQIGTTGNCVHDPGRSLGYPNGDTPLDDGNFLISEIHGSWISEYTRAGKMVWSVQLPIAYPSDPQQLGPDLYLVADYTTPGGLVEFTREGRIVWSYRPTSGAGMLDHPSLAEQFANGLIGINDDYRHRVVLLDPATNTIVWQYGQTDRAGTGRGLLNTPDGFDLLLPDASTPNHPVTG